MAGTGGPNLEPRQFLMTESPPDAGAVQETVAEALPAAAVAETFSRCKSYFARPAESAK